MSRLLAIDTSDYYKLRDGDACWHLGEYTSGGGFNASKTNQQIFNLKKPLTATQSELYYKGLAVEYWARQLSLALSLPAVGKNATLVPAPCSKVRNDPVHDDRIERVLARLRRFEGSLDVRPLLRARVNRPSQHEGRRLSVAELQESMEVDVSHLSSPIREHVIVVDDVFTQGGTFAAMRNHLSPLPGVTKVYGIFLARTIWPSGLEPEQ